MTMSIDAKLVAELRKRTGLPMMKCKKALTAADGDIEKAADELRKQGAKAAEKVAHRELEDGLVFCKSTSSGACAVSLLCQTDFVAKSDDFVKFGERLVDDLFQNAPADTGTGEELGDYRLSDGTAIKEVLEGFALKIREKIQVGSYARFKPEQGAVFAYVHHNRKVAALVELAGEGPVGKESGGKGLADSEAARQLGNDLGMQVTFHRDVQTLTRDSLDQEWVAKEREIFQAQVREMPENKRAQIAEGKLSKRLRDVVLLEQPFIKNDKLSVLQQVQEVAKEAGTDIAIRRFARISAGA